MEFTRAHEVMEKYQVPVILEFILERGTNISMGTEIDGVNEFEEILWLDPKLSIKKIAWTDVAVGQSYPAAQEILPVGADYLVVHAVSWNPSPWLDFPGRFPSATGAQLCWRALEPDRASGISQFRSDRFASRAAFPDAVENNFDRLALLTAHATRAVLFAKATVATLKCRRLRSPESQAFFI